MKPKSKATTRRSVGAYFLRMRFAATACLLSLSHAVAAADKPTLAAAKAAAHETATACEHRTADGLRHHIALTAAGVPVEEASGCLLRKLSTSKGGVGSAAAWGLASAAAPGRPELLAHARAQLGGKARANLRANPVALTLVLTLTLTLTRRANLSRPRGT